MITCITWAAASACLITLWIWLSSPYDRGFADGVRAERMRARLEWLATFRRITVHKPEERP